MYGSRVQNQIGDVESDHQDQSFRPVYMRALRTAFDILSELQPIRLAV